METVVCSIFKSKKISKVANLYCKTTSSTLVKEIIFGIVLFLLIPVAFAQEYPELGVRVETVADNLTIPWSIDFAPDGRIFFTERIGDLRVIQDGQLLQPIMSLDVAGGEGGLLGVVLDPDFEQNHYVYLYLTYNEFFETKNKVVRYVESENSLKEDKIRAAELVSPSRAEHAGPALVDGIRLAEGVGFEPTVDVTAYNGFKDHRLQPLSHPSTCSI